MSTRTALALSLGLALCGGCDEDEPEVVAPPAPAPAIAPEPSYSIHEWGFVGHHWADREDDPPTFGAGPGTWEGGGIADGFGIGGLGLSGTGRGGGKPILYVHLPEGVDEMTFSVALSLGPGGRILEHLPPAPMSLVGARPTLRWDGVVARPGECRPSRPYPSAAAGCEETPDGYCEAAELASYETPDGACLRFDGEDWEHLFYRATIPGELPLRLDRDGDAIRVRHQGAAPLPGRLMRVRRDEGGASSRVTFHDAPAPGAEISLAQSPEQPGAAGVSALRATLGELGLTGPETDAFLRAWQRDLFGGEPGVALAPQVGEPPEDLRPKADALLYWLPPEAMDALVPLSFEPAPTEVRRAILVRVDLSPIGFGGGGTIGLGNLRRLGRSATLELGELDVVGLDAERATTVVRRQLGGLRGCWDEAVAHGSEHAAVTLLLGVAPDGAVRSASVTRSDAGDTALEDCLMGRARRITLPDPPDGEATVELPLSLGTTAR